MSTPLTRGEQARQFYNAAATTSTDFCFMNYGYAPLSAELASSAEPERYCLQLYRHLLGGADLTGKRVVEVSCGRGGGAAHVASTYKPLQYMGIDISEKNVALATQRFGDVPGLSFEVGNAEALPLSSNVCQALINVEASHLYDNPLQFFSEAWRVLDRGGAFFHVDLTWKDKDPAKLIEAAGFSVDQTEDITDNVRQALELDSDRREQIVMSFPEQLRADFRDWSGVKGHRAHKRLATGEWKYIVTRAVKK
ncbi:MAG: class I SAM-dependent methyltransferase [Pseudomonadota bacterium]